MTKIPDLPEQTTLADGDLFTTVDVSDATDDPGGSSKRTLWSTIKGLLVSVTGQTGTVDLSTATTVVADAVATGQAIAYGQAGAQLDGVTLSGVNTFKADAPNDTFLIIDAPTGRSGYLYFKSDSVDRFRWQITNAGALNLYGFDSAKTPISLDPSGNVNLSGATGVYVPTPLEGATAAAAKVVAFDSATGRMAVQGPNVLEQGDTGWRDIPMIDGWSATRLRVRRTGNNVSWHASNVSPAAATGSNLNADLGVGWANTASGVFPVTVDGYDGVDSRCRGVLIGTNSSQIVMLGGAVQFGARVDIEMTYATTDAWPTSLPGSTPV